MSKTLIRAAKREISSVGTPISDRVVIKQFEAAEQTEGGIAIPEASQEKPDSGIVVAVGAGRHGEPMIVKVGNKVIYGQHAGIPVRLKGEDYLIMREIEILIIL